MNNKAIIMTVDFTCRNGLLDIGAEISAPVGLSSRSSRCLNIPDDVRTVQRLLNRFPTIEGGPIPKLVVDGIIGPLTDKAIGHFQAKWKIVSKYSKQPDHIVDPGGKTIDRLKKGPTGKTGMPSEFMKNIPRVIEVITASRAALSLAKSHLIRGSSSGPIPSVGEFSKAALARVERHFRVQKMGDPIRRVEAVERVFLEMLVAIGHVPQGVILAMDEPPEIAEGAFMFTFTGGYHLLTSKEDFKGLARSSIYLCPKAKTLDRDAFVYSMIHELAHFVGPKENGITDFAYFHKNQKNYFNLSPPLTLRNADCFSQFAYDAIGKANFNIVTHQVL